MHRKNFKSNKISRAVLYTELDTYYAKLSGLTEEFCYIFNFKDIYCEGFLEKLFRLLKEKKIKQFGEYKIKN